MYGTCTMSLLEELKELLKENEIFIDAKNNLLKNRNLGQGKTQYIQVPFSAISDKKYHIKNIIAKFLRIGK